VTHPATLSARLHDLYGGPYWAPTGFGEWLYHHAVRPPRRKWTRRGEILNRVCDRIYADVIAQSDTFTPFDSIEALRDFIRDPRTCDVAILAALKEEHRAFWHARGKQVAA
jgi:hypothetical protein